MLRFNILINLCIGLSNSISIHPMLRFNIEKIGYKFQLLTISIHPMLRFNYAKVCKSINVRTISIHPMLRFNSASLV